MEKREESLKEGLRFILWVVYAIGIGVVVGLVAVSFHHGIDHATHARARMPEMIWMLPAAGAAIVLLYRASGMEKDRGTNLVLIAVRDNERIRLRTAPLIFVSTILTHLVGGSAGREGAALQLGGSLGAYVGRLLKLDGRDQPIMVKCGMAAAFSALFGTPMTAAIFAMEVVRVGVMHYDAFVPTLISALTAVRCAKYFGMHQTVVYDMGPAPDMVLSVVLRTVALGLLCAMVSVLFCKVMHKAPHLYAKYCPDPMIRAMVGGTLVLILTLLLGHQTYSGAGDDVIRRMLGGETIPEAFLLKILFTALTLGAGFRGGEIVPVLFTGCAFGTLVGPMLGLPHGFSGALGMAAVFCGATNCPISSILLSYELFGGDGLPVFGVACAVSYALSGYYGLYSEQKIAYSKTHTQWIDINAE